MKLVRNVLIIGSNADRANDRLRAIKHELETNELLVELYGDLRGSVWNEGRIVLANGVCIQAFGRGQALRGVKHHDARPDLCFVDDCEEEEHVRSPEARQETLRWFMTELVPALDNHARLRVAATPLDREALSMVLARQSGWITKAYPIEYIDAQGVHRAAWPSRFPLKWVEEKREGFQSLGLQAEFSQEFLCVPEDPASAYLAVQTICQYAVETRRGSVLKGSAFPQAVVRIPRQRRLIRGINRNRVGLLSGVDKSQ
jgi:hypothetical protein